MPNTAPTFAFRKGFVQAEYDIGSDFERATSLTLQSDGRIVVVGWTENQFGVLRFNGDGTLDTTFDGDGRLTTTFGVPPFNSARGTGVVQQADGRLVVGGYMTQDGGDHDFAVARYNANGSLDTTFSGDGKVTTTVGSGADIANGLALQADGRIVLVGSAIPGSNEDFAVVRYNTNGSLDTSFDGDGKVTTDFGGGIDAASSVAIQSDGKIVVVGSSRSGADFDFAVVRYNSNGTLDLSFDDDGKVTTPIGSSHDFATSVILQADGKILVAGSTENDYVDFALVRYNTDGSLDTTFSGDGKLTTAIGGYSDRGQSVTLQADGKILVAGYGIANLPDSNDFALVRYNADGSLDMSFGGDGIVTTNFSEGSADQAMSVKVQADGRIVVAGETQIDGKSDVVVARYNSDGSLDTTFGQAGISTLDGAPTYTEGGPAVVLDNNVHVQDAELAGQGSYAGATLRLSRNGGASAEDAFSATGALGGLAQGASLTYSGVTVGTVTTNSGGTLLLTFNANATQARVDGVLEAIAYSNASNHPPASVRIDWVFSDGNNGGQGTGGSLAVTGSTTVTIIDTITYLWSTLTNGQVITAFDPDDDRLRFDLGISAADVRVDAGAGFVAFSYGGKTVTLNIDQASITTQNVVFQDVSVLVVGDGTTGVSGDAAGNVLQGSAGDDQLIGLGGGDNLSGAGGDDVLIGGADGDTLNGGADFDRASYQSAGAGVDAYLGSPGSNTGDAAGDTYLSIEGLIGSAYRDTLVGDNNVNGIEGGDGNDSLVGAGGNDIVRGGNGDDYLYGGTGADLLDGGTGFDYARYDSATAGVVVYLGSPAGNTGEAAGDTYQSIEGLVGTSFRDTLMGDNNVNDTQGRGGNDSLYGLAGNDTVRGGDGDDYLTGGTGADVLDGGAGFDYARYDSAATGVTVDLAGTLANTGEASGDHFIAIEGVVGSSFGDFVYGDNSANNLQGRDGDDTISGRGGNDDLWGGNGNDTLDGGLGLDSLLGDAGNDTFEFTAGEAGGDRVLDFAGNGASAGDRLIFQGYGTAAQHATFTNIDATRWSINSASNRLVHDIITFSNAAAVHVTDYTFI